MSSHHKCNYCEKKEEKCCPPYVVICCDPCCDPCCRDPCCKKCHDHHEHKPHCCEYKCCCKKIVCCKYYTGYREVCKCDDQCHHH